MKPPYRLLSGIAWLLVPLAVTAVEGQDPQHAVARDFECLAASLRPLVKINFEDLPHRASSCPDLLMPVEPLPNPLEISGVKFTDPWCMATGFCSAPTCSRDEDNPYPGNIVLSLADRGVLQCLKAADVDDSGALDVTDAVNLLSYQFLGGPAPREPFRSCGPDATQDDLSCASGPPCP